MIWQRSAAVLEQLYPQPESALMAGILLGDDSGLPEDAQQAFRDTGTAHIVAISGFNIAILAGLIVLLLGKILPRATAALGAVIWIGAYTLLVGGSPPVVRAAIMGAVGLFGGLIGRRQAGVNSLTFTAADWDIPKTVTLFAASDVDTQEDTAVLRTSSSGLASIDTNVRVTDRVVPLGDVFANGFRDGFEDSL